MMENSSKAAKYFETTAYETTSRRRDVVCSLQVIVASTNPSRYYTNIQETTSSWWFHIRNWNYYVDIYIVGEKIVGLCIFTLMLFA